jgi:bacteriorhodopsin
MSLFALWYARSTYLWLWASVGAVYWLFTGMLLLVPARRLAKERSTEIHDMFVISALVLAMGQVSIINQALYPTSLVLLKFACINNAQFFIFLGVLDFITRVGLGIYFCLNWGAFSNVNILRTEIVSTGDERDRLIRRNETQ